jgi:HlyD family secretion protein
MSAERSTAITAEQSNRQKSSSSLFRKAALERLSSPEQLDYLISITSPIAWIAVAAIGLICLVILIWGIFGRIPDKVTGRGILVRGGAVFGVSAGVEGSVSEIFVHTGQTVLRDQPIARMNRPQLEAKIQLQKELIRHLQERHAEATAREEQSDRTSTAALDKESQTLQRIIDDLTPQSENLNKFLQTQMGLKEKGLVPEDAVIKAREGFFSVQKEILDSRVKQLDVVSQRDKIVRETTQARNQRLNGIDEAMKDLRTFESELSLTTMVKSPYAGRVVETLVGRGDAVNPKDRIATIEAENAQMQATIFVPAGSGKKVGNGMIVQIAPSTVKPEEYGFMIGQVLDVSPFPSTPESMQQVLHNDQLVKELMAPGTPIEVHAIVLPDSHTQSGYRWSSPQGPPVEIHTGTPCSGNIVTSLKRPIEFVIPKIKETLGIQ